MCIPWHGARFIAANQVKLIGPSLAKRLAHISVTPSQLAQNHRNSISADFAANLSYRLP